MLLKVGKKLKLYVIFKGATFNSTREYYWNTVAYELLNRLQDNCSNSYPPENQIHLVCNETGNSNGILIKDVLEKIIFPFIRVEGDNQRRAY